jgi:hypothetical protein
MPQLKGQAVEGTPAFKKNPKGEVSGEEEFAESLRKKGVKMIEKQVPAERLKATQNELVGAKVAGGGASLILGAGFVGAKATEFKSAQTVFEKG